MIACVDVVRKGMAFVETDNELLKRRVVWNDCGSFICSGQAAAVGENANDDSVVRFVTGSRLVVIQDSCAKELARIFSALHAPCNEFVEKLEVLDIMSTTSELKQASGFDPGLPACCHRLSRPIRICDNLPVTYQQCQ